MRERLAFRREKGPPPTEEIRELRRLVAMDTYTELAALFLGVAETRELTTVELLRLLLAKAEAGEG